MHYPLFLACETQTPLFCSLGVGNTEDVAENTGMKGHVSASHEGANVPDVPANKAAVGCGVCVRRCTVSEPH